MSANNREWVEVECRLSSQCLTNLLDLVAELLLIVNLKDPANALGGYGCVRDLQLRCQENVAWKQWNVRS